MRALAEPGPATQAKLRWADLRLRVISALVLAPVALVCLWVGGWPWVGLVGLATIGALVEWIALCRHRGGRAMLLAGLLYLALAAASLVWLRSDATVGWINLVFVLLVVWSSDIGAYAVGRLVGGARLAPAISPGKTWSGAAGGLAAALAVGWLVAGAAGPSGLSTLVVAGALGGIAQAGDLLESALKRHFGVKDSSHLIPGHGGLLDRVDGLLAAAPAAALLALDLGRGVVLWQ